MGDKTGGKDGMTNQQFVGVIKMIIALLENDVPRSEITGYLKELIS